MSVQDYKKERGEKRENARIKGPGRGPPRSTAPESPHPFLFCVDAGQYVDGKKEYEMTREEEEEEAQEAQEEEEEEEEGEEEEEEGIDRSSLPPSPLRSLCL